MPQTTGGTAAGNAGTSSTSDKGGGMTASPQAGNTAQAGSAPQAGSNPSACTTDAQCVVPAPRCSELGSCVACVSDEDCPLDSANRCASDGRCVACVETGDCNDGATCEVVSGTCQTPATPDGGGNGGAGGNGG